MVSPISTRARGDVARPLEQALAVGALAAYLSRGPSLLPRTPEDQTLIAAGAGAVGAVTGLVAERVTGVLGRRLPGGRAGASAVAGALGAGGWLWASAAEERTAVVNAVETISGIAMLAAGGGEAGRLALGALPIELRAFVTSRALALGVAAASALQALRRRIAEPDRQAPIPYEYLSSVSGGEASLAPLWTLDRQGRKFLGMAVPGDAIAAVMGTPAQDPIRVYVGLDTAPTPRERASIAVAELERLGAFERRRILVACPTGAGFVTPIPVEAEEYMTRGDIASVAIQYNNERSHRSLGKVPIGATTTRLLLEALRQRVDRIARGERPELIVYGESLGAWVAAEVLAEGALGTLDELRVARAMLIGLPYRPMRMLARLAESEGVMPGRIRVCETSEQVASLPEPERERLAYVLLTHPEDPVGNFSGLRLLVERPTWLSKGPRRHPRVPREMRWLPGITYLQVLFDVKNGTSFTADFEAYAHDYRLGLPAVARIVYGHQNEVSPEQLARIEERTAASAQAQERREASALASAPRTSTATLPAS